MAIPRPVQEDKPVLHHGTLWEYRLDKTRNHHPMTRRNTTLKVNDMEQYGDIEP
jgi:hypothetical protein